MTEFDFIETPESVELQRKLAGIGTRFVAGLLDTLILIGLFVLLFLALMVVAWGRIFGRGGLLDEAAMWEVAVFILLIFLVYWGYFVFFEMRTGGQSPGKKSQKIRVVKDGGGAITFTDVAIRNLLRVVDGWPLYPVAGIVMFATRKAQRLGDLAAGTVVVSEATSGYAARADKRANTQWEREASAEALRATGLTPEEYRVLASYWARRNELEFSARQRILTTVILPVLRRRGVSPPNETAATLEYYVGTLMRKAKFAEQQAGGPAGPKEGAS